MSLDGTERQHSLKRTAYLLPYVKSAQTGDMLLKKCPELTIEQACLACFSLDETRGGPDSDPRVEKTGVVNKGAEVWTEKESSVTTQF